jgi:hypothetical protein
MELTKVEREFARGHHAETGIAYRLEASAG